MIRWKVNGCLYIGMKECVYGSTLRKEIKTKYGLRGKVEDHHMIPREFRDHPVIIRTGYEIDANDNLKMMPNRKYEVADYILRHEPHKEYNKYIRSYLDSLERYDIEAQHNRLVLFNRGLFERLNYKNMLPWR